LLRWLNTRKVRITQNKPKKLNQHMLVGGGGNPSTWFAKWE